MSLVSIICALSPRSSLIACCSPSFLPSLTVSFVLTSIHIAYTASANYFSNDASLFSHLLQQLQNSIRIFLVNNVNIPDSHVERVVHLVFSDVSLLLYESEDGQRLPTAPAYLGAKPLGKYSRDVFPEAAACDVGNPLYPVLFHHGSCGF